MKKPIFLNLALVCSMVGFSSLAAIAETPLSINPQASSPTVLLPKSTAIVVTFPTDIVIENVRKMQEQPVTLLLAQPLLDGQGNVLAIANAPVSGRLKPSGSGVQIIVDSLVIAGRVVPVQATSPIIPAKEITTQRGIDRAREHGTVASSLAGGAGEVFSQNPNIGDKIEAAAGLLGALIGMVSPKKVHAIGIPSGSSYILTLQTPLAVPVE